MFKTPQTIRMIKFLFHKNIFFESFDVYDNNILYTHKYPDWQKVINKLRFFWIIFLIICAFTLLINLTLFVSVPLVAIIFYTIYKSIIWFKQRKNFFLKKYYLRTSLLEFIRINKLYLENIEEYEFRDDKGVWRTKQRKVISDAAAFNIYYDPESLIEIRIEKGYNPLINKLENLDNELQALVGLPLSRKKVDSSFVIYTFLLKHPERLILKSSPVREIIENHDINLGYGVSYNPVKCPHILIAGGTGSGKSVFISYLILEFLKRNSTIYIADPKNSDLGSLSYYLGDERVATNLNNIARIIRLAVTEMQERYNNMRKNFKYGSNFVDHGYKPIWIIFDEMGAFQASGTDKNSKTVVNEVMDGIKQIILLGRQAGVFILVSAQQMRSETLNTDLRDNLGLRIALGANSSEGYRMVFGSASPTIQPIEVKGAGFLYMQGAGKETAEYWESPYFDFNQFDFITELQLYIT